MFKIIAATYKAFVAFSIMMITGSIALMLKWMSFGYSTNWGARWIIAPGSRLSLRLIGIRYEFPKRASFPDKPVMYTFNHNSFMDLLILTSLAIPDTRFFLSENTKRLIPVTIAANAIGVYYIPVKKDRKRRADFFKKMTTTLKKSKESVFVSSEGVHKFVHGISRFNDGVYIMAMKAHLPIIPIYLHIPKKANPFEGYQFGMGKISAHVLQQFDTDTWRLETISEHKNEVRSLFVNAFNEHHGTDPS